jgi:undecaprenyl-diphosphatase
MNTFQALILGIVQGLTEFLPVSSSGHLALLSNVPAWTAQPLVFDTTLHLATAMTLVVYFWNDLMVIVKSFLKDSTTKKFDVKNYAFESKMLFYILFASIPAGVLGLVFESDLEEKFRSVASVALFMFLGTALMAFAQKYSQKRLSIQDITPAKSVKIGLFQALALLPGFSRSGSTIAGGMLSGLSQVDAARFSFLMSIPIAVLAGVYKLISTDWGSTDLSLNVLVVGFISSFLVGLWVVHFLLNYLKSHGLNIFIYYRLVLVAVLTFLVLR